MKIENSNKCANTLDDCAKWLFKTFPILKGKPMSIEVNAQGKVNHIEVDYDLSKNDIKKIKEKYPELST